VGFLLPSLRLLLFLLPPLPVPLFRRPPPLKLLRLRPSLERGLYSGASPNSSGTGIKSWANQTVQQASQRVMQALGKAAKKNVVRLKYGTRVYLVDESQKDKKKGRN
jgi:hypothetical protein